MNREVDYETLLDRLSICINAYDFTMLSMAL